MPLLFRCNELQAGMRLAEPLVLHGRVLLTKGKILTHADVSILGRQYPQLCARIGDPILDDLIEFEDDGHDRGVAATVQHSITQAMGEVGERFSCRASMADVNIGTLHDSVAAVIAYLNANPVSAALLTRCLDTSSYLSDHAGNVFYLSTILGAAVRDYVLAERRRQTSCRWLPVKVGMDMLPLGLGAMLIDLGMYPLQHLYKKSGLLTEAEREAVRNHPLAGASALPSEISAVTRMIVRTHHENYDGSGYPDGIKGDRAHIFTRIVRIVDAFDAATAAHVYKRAKSPARVLWEMTAGPYRRFYDPVLMKVFARLIQPFPIGAKIRLTDGRYAVVVRYNRANSFRPTVVVCFDADGRRLPDRELAEPIPLQERLDLQLASMGGENLSFLREPPPVDTLVPGPEHFADLFEASFP